MKDLSFLCWNVGVPERFECGNVVCTVCVVVSLLKIFFKRIVKRFEGQGAFQWDVCKKIK